MTDTTPATDLAAGLAKLREPFPAESIGKLPKVTCKDCSKRSCQKEGHAPKRCGECHGWLSPQHIHLDYVGHAEVTDRLLSVDPTWQWEPMALDDRGLPLVSTDGSEAELWIRLTVCGVTRLGVGTVAAGASDLAKQLVSDALRNAAMRFGVGLDLWAKGELESGRQVSVPAPPPDPVSEVDRAAVVALARQLQNGERERFVEWLRAEHIPPLVHPDLSADQAQRVKAFLTSHDVDQEPAA